MAKQPKRRIAEQKYIKRVHDLIAQRKKVVSTGRTPWKQFFSRGVGAEIVTEIPKSSIHSIIYTYGKKMGKRFVCSFVEQDEGSVLVKIEAIKRRN